MGKEFKKASNVVYVCNGPKCKKRGGKELRKLFKKLKEEKEICGLEVIKTGCTDRCKYAPVVAFQPQNIWLPCVNEMKAREEMDKIFSKNKVDVTK